MKHLAGNTERLCTCVEGGELSDSQFAATQRERDPGETGTELIAGVDGAFDR